MMSFPSTANERRFIASAVVVAAALANVGVVFVVQTIELPLRLGSVFTALAAIRLGPMAGLLTAIGTGGTLEMTHHCDGTYAAFIPGNVLLGISIGVGAVDYPTPRVLRSIMTLLVVSVASTAVVTLIGIDVYTGHGSLGPRLVRSMSRTLGLRSAGCPFLSLLPGEVIDKTIAISAVLLFSGRRRDRLPL